MKRRKEKKTKVYQQIIDKRQFVCLSVAATAVLVPVLTQ